VPHAIDLRGGGARPAARCGWGLRRRVDVDPDNDLPDAGECQECRFRLVFDRLRHLRIVGRQRHLNGHVGAHDPHILDEAK
jgi:hypothetical protein